MGERPLVTVIMAAYNCEDYVAEAIESVIAQTYPHWELLCIDDCSTDSTRDVISRYADADERVRLLCNTRNMGAAATRNRGIEAARGEYIAILDADDVCMPDRLERSLVAFREHPEVGLVGSGARLIDGSGADKGVWQKHRLVHSSVMMRTDVVRDIGGYDEFFRYGQDKDLYWRLSLRYRFLLLEEPLVKYRWHGSQMSVDHSLEQRAYGTLARERHVAVREGRAVDLRARLEELRRSPELRADCAYNIGWSWLLAGDARMARACFAETMRLTPPRLGAWLWYALSALPRSLRAGLIAAWFASKRALQRRATGVISWSDPASADGSPHELSEAV